jgi:hypothetical protein
MPILVPSRINQARPNAPEDGAIGGWTQGSDKYIARSDNLTNVNSATAFRSTDFTDGHIAYMPVEGGVLGDAGRAFEISGHIESINGVTP